MALVTAVNLAHLPPSITVLVSLFKDVQNASFLRDQLVAGNADFEYAFVDASMIISTTHLLTTISRSLHNLRHAALRTRNVHAEIVFSLSPTNNIADSFRRFGVSAATTNLLAVKVSTAEQPVTQDEVSRFLGRVVEGTSVPFGVEEVQGLTDVEAVGKVYKLGKRGAEVGDEVWRREAEVAAMGMIALKGS